MAMTDGIRTERTGAVLTVVFDRPERRNAIGDDGLDRLLGLANAVGSDESVRAVILTGAGEKAFTAGYDLKALAEVTPESFANNRWSEVWERWAVLPKPVIAALNGACMGGGVHVAMAADLRVSVPGVRMMIPASRFGFVYSQGAIARIAATLGPAFAAELLYLGGELTVEDVARTGFVRRIVEPDVLQSVAMDFAERAAGMAPLAVAGMKEMVREGPDAARIKALVGRCLGSDDFREGIAALGEKRTPAFKGR